jgi:hypothetical protein
MTPLLLIHAGVRLAVPRHGITEKEEKMSEEIIPYASREVRSDVGREVFGVIVRTVGFLLSLYGIYCAVYFALLKVVSVPSSPSYPHG